MGTLIIARVVARIKVRNLTEDADLTRFEADVRLKRHNVIVFRPMPWAPKRLLDKLDSDDVALRHIIVVQKCTEAGRSIVRYTAVVRAIDYKLLTATIKLAIIVQTYSLHSARYQDTEPELGSERFKLRALLTLTPTGVKVHIVEARMVNDPSQHGW